jgi:hypothetical protein
LPVPNPKSLFQDRDLYGITIRQSVITNSLKQEKGRASCPATCRPQKTKLNRTVPTNRVGRIESSGDEISSVEIKHINP